MKLDNRIIPLLVSMWTYSGFPGGSPIPGCCFLLLASAASELLLLETGCLQPLSCQTFSALLLEDGGALLLEDESGFLALE